MTQHPRLKRRINGPDGKLLRAFDSQLPVPLSLFKPIMQHIGHALIETRLHDPRRARFAEFFVELEHAGELGGVRDFGEEGGEDAGVFDGLGGALGAGVEM